jgi:hypothetical protein
MFHPIEMIIFSSYGLGGANQKNTILKFKKRMHCHNIMSFSNKIIPFSLVILVTALCLSLSNIKLVSANGGPPVNNSFSNTPTFSPSNNTTSSTQTTPPTVQPSTEQTLGNASAPAQGPPANLKARGTINSLVAVPATKWIATGNWSLDIDNGNLTGFVTNMSFFDERGTATHTHEFLNLRPDPDYKVVSQLPNSSITIRGVMDVGTNHKIVWKNVPTEIDIKGGKTITISVDDKSTNNHFASQPILGVLSTTASGLNIDIVPAKAELAAGDDQKISVTVSDSTSGKKIAAAKITGVMIDAFPGAKKLIKDMNSTEPIDTTKIEGKKFSGVTDQNGEYSVSETIPTGKRTGTYTIVVTSNAEGYNPVSEIKTFKVTK